MTSERLGNIALMNVTVERLSYIEVMMI